MQRSAAAFALLISTFVGTVFGQHSVDPYQRYHRLICLVHLAGSGTASDPIRPEYVPTSADAPSGSGILAWSFQITDDQQMAIVQYVAADPKAFASILADTRPEVLIFEIGKDDRNTIETAMQKYKAGFNLDRMKLPVR
jgi:hypothetical protein